jgi:hypothetical protein
MDEASTLLKSLSSALGQGSMAAKKEVPNAQNGHTNDGR